MILTTPNTLPSSLSKRPPHNFPCISLFTLVEGNIWHFLYLLWAKNSSVVATGVQQFFGVISMSISFSWVVGGHSSGNNIGFEVILENQVRLNGREAVAQTMPLLRLILSCMWAEGNLPSPFMNSWKEMPAALCYKDGAIFLLIFGLCFLSCSFLSGASHLASWIHEGK